MERCFQLGVEWSTDLLRKEAAFSAFAAVISGAAADYRCCKAKLEDRIGALLAAASVSL